MALPYFPFYHSDYTSKTGHLSLVEHGAYIRLLCHYYANGSIPDEIGCFRLCSALDAKEQESVRSILRQFFPDGRNKKADEVMSDWEKKYQAKVESGRKSAEKRWVSHNEPNGSPNRLVTTNPVTNGCKLELELEPELKQEQKPEKPKPCRFAPPTVEEVRAYCVERGNKVDPDTFVDFYASKGWLVGKVGMKDWKAAVRTWEKGDSANGRKGTGYDRPLANRGPVATPGKYDHLC